MCTTNGYPPEEKAHDILDEPTYDTGNTLIKFDIGEFVHSHRKTLILSAPWLNLVNSLLDIIRWKSPYCSIFWLSLSCVFAVFSPVLLIVSVLVYFLLIMTLSAVKNSGKQKKKPAQRTIKRKADNNDLNVKATVEKQVKEDIREFIAILVKLEEVTDLVVKGLEELNRILKWEDFKSSISVFLGLLIAVLVLLTIPLAMLLVVIILALFCLNDGFKPVAWHCVAVSKDSFKHFLSLVCVMDVFSAKHQINNPPSSNDEDKWYDAEISCDPGDMTSDDHDDDDSDSFNYEDSSLNTKKLHDSSSILTQLADYRRKQKKLNSGKCRLCEVPFSSILKKRQYCRHCGESFCSKCCSHKVKRSVFGATAPAAYEETVLVCKPCFDVLMNAFDQSTVTTAW